MSNHAPKVDPIAKIVFLISLLAIVAVVYIFVSNLISTYQRNSTKGEVDSSHLILNAEENLKPIGISSTSDEPAKETPKKEASKIEKKPVVAEKPVNETPAAKSVTHEIKMLNSGENGTMIFEPSSLNVAVGDTVKFIPTDAGHNAASNFIPDGATGWKSNIGEEFSVTIDKEGIYLYQCDPHLVMGMVGVIQAGKAINKDAAVEKAKELSGTFAIGKDRFEKYINGLDSMTLDTKKK